MVVRARRIGFKTGNLAPIALLVSGIALGSADAERLEPGYRVERQLRGGEVHSYTVRLERGQFLRLAVDQRGIDVVTFLADSSGRERLAVDTQLGIFGRETLCFVADRTDLYRITVTAFDPEVVPGRYELSVVAMRSADATDRVRGRAALAQYRAGMEEKTSIAESLHRAVDAYRESARLWARAGEPREEGVVLYTLGTALRTRGDTRKERDAYVEALALARSEKDRQLEAKLLDSLAWNRALRGEPGEALVLAESAMVISKSIGDRQNQANALQAKGLSLYWLGRYQEALDCGRQGLELAEQLRDRTSQAWTWRAIGDSYTALGDSVRALRAFDKARDLFRATQNTQGLTLTLEGAGFLCWQIGAYRRALSLYEESLSIAVRAGQRQGEALARNNIGLVRLSLGELESARTELERALPLWRSGGAAHGEALSLHNLGKVDELEGRAESSERYQRALELFRRLGEPNGEARVLASIAQAQRKAGHLDEALGRIEESLAIFDSLGRQLAAPDLRRSFLAFRQNAYAIAVDILADLDLSRPNQGFAARAFQATERARARTLVESLTEARLDMSSELPKELSSREAELSARLGRLQKELAGSGDRKAAEERIASAEEEWDGLIAEIRRRNPRYASLRYPDPISWEEARALLDSETAIISFSATADRFVVFRLTSLGVDVRRLAISRADLEEQVENYVALISRDEGNRWEELSRRLEAEVVDPWLNGLPPSIRRLVIVPDAALNSLPFESLPAGAAGETLLSAFTISYAPSVTALAALSSGRKDSGTDGPTAVFALASPPLGSRVVGEAGEGEAFDLPPLPFAAAEARSIYRFGGKGSELCLGAEANERRIKDKDLRSFGILHFATHALLSSRAPTRSALLLAADGGSGTGLLPAREIYRLRLASELVTLSACRTASGRVLPGEGVQGLAQAFFHAGARSVLASLWDVSDRRTADLMSRFYERLARGEPKAEALRSAKLDMLRRDPRLPLRYWAAFVLLGEPAGTISLSSPPVGIGWGAAAVAGGISAGLWTLAKRRKQKSRSAG